MNSYTTRLCGVAEGGEEAAWRDYEEEEEGENSVEMTVGGDEDEVDGAGGGGGGGDSGHVDDVSRASSSAATLPADSVEGLMMAEKGDRLSPLPRAELVRSNSLPLAEQQSEEEEEEEDSGMGRAASDAGGSSQVNEAL